MNLATGLQRALVAGGFSLLSACGTPSSGMVGTATDAATSAIAPAVATFPRAVGDIPADCVVIDASGQPQWAKTTGCVELQRNGQRSNTPFSLPTSDQYGYPVMGGYGYMYPDDKNVYQNYAR